MNARLLVTTLIQLASVAVPASEFFVAPNGSHQNPGTEGKPFASFQRAQEAVRAERASGNSAVTVTFRAGAYHLEKPVEFSPADSGVSVSLPVRYRALPGGEVVISGGRTVSGWSPEPEHPGVWKARAPIPEFNQLWVNGKRAVRARTPNYWEFSAVRSVTEEPAGSRFKHAFKVAPESLALLKGLDQPALRRVQMVIFHKWDTTREPVDSVSPDEGMHYNLRNENAAVERDG